MNILLLCGSLEPGKDGVGDYTRRLAAGLIRSGHHARIIALNDHFIAAQLEENQLDDGVQVPVLRLTPKMPLSARIAFARGWIRKIQPHWISLQYVPYSFHEKGMPLFWISQFKQLSDPAVRWHIMFHELWIGSVKEDSWREKGVGLIQRAIIKRTIHKIRPTYVTTNTGHYRNLLQQIGVTAQLLPVFSNMPLGDKRNTQLLEKLPNGVLQNRNEWYIAALFGSIHMVSGVENSIHSLVQKARQENKKVLIAHIGRSANATAFFEQLQKADAINCFAFGEQPAEDIASFFQQIDFGLSTYNSTYLDKSGSIAAMLYNGLPVVLLRPALAAHGYRSTHARFEGDIPALSAFSIQPKEWSAQYNLENAISFYINIFNQYHE